MEKSIASQRIVNIAPPMRIRIAPPKQINIVPPGQLDLNGSNQKEYNEFDYLRQAVNRASYCKRDNPLSLPRYRRMVTAPQPPNEILDGISQERNVMIEDSTPPRFISTILTNPPDEENEKENLTKIGESFSTEYSTIRVTSSSMNLNIKAVQQAINNNKSINDVQSIQRAINDNNTNYLKYNQPSLLDTQTAIKKVSDKYRQSIRNNIEMIDPYNETYRQMIQYIIIRCVNKNY